MQLNSNNKDQQDDYSEGQRIHRKGFEISTFYSIKAPYRITQNIDKTAPTARKKKKSRTKTSACMRWTRFSNIYVAILLAQ